MKKRVKDSLVFFGLILFMLLILSLSFIIGSFITGSTINNKDNINKIEKKVLSEINEKDKATVMIDINEVNKTNKGLFNVLSSNKRVNKKELPGKIRHDFGDRISLEVTKEELDELKNNKDVKEISSVGKKYLLLDDSAPLINATPTWNLTPYNTNLTGKGESVCVLDTGANFSHPDLKEENLTCVIDCVNNPCTEDCSLSDSDGHGTHVSGIITANGSLKGIAPASKIIMIKIFEGNTASSDDDIAAGIDWCVNNANEFNISAISMSFGTENQLFDEYCDDADTSVDLTPSINDAVAKNISVIAATGNNGNHTHISSPACIKNVTAVGSSDKSDEISSFSNRNNITDLFAPGENIYSTYLASEGGYSTGSGTSMAVPHVAAAFAIINQFNKLELNKTLKPIDTQNTLNFTGKKIPDSDSKSGLNFSRIDIYNAIFSLDETSPNVTLISPENNSLKESSNITLECNATDELKLKNLTIKLLNSTGNITNSSSFNTTKESLNAKTNLTNLSSGKYFWNCISYDKGNNKGYYQTNYTFSLFKFDLLTTLNSPTNNTYTSENLTTFNCTSQTNSRFALSNITFYLWNFSNQNSTLIYNSTKNITGTLNTTLFNYTFENETTYLWNCLSRNNNSDTEFASKNYTITYDETKPNATLISPEEDYSATGSKNITFEYNLTETNPSNCSLIINNQTNQTNSSINTSITNSFVEELSTGKYIWKINCSDLAGHEVNSSERTITLNEETDDTTSSSGSGGGGGGGGGIIYNEYEITKDELQKGISKELKENENMSFSITNKSHKLTLNRINKVSVNITINSKKINLIIYKGQTKKLNLNSDNYYELFVKLNSVNYNNANITIKKINETISDKEISDKNDTEPNSTESNLTEDESDEPETKKIDFGKRDSLLLKIVVFLILFLVLYKGIIEEILYKIKSKYKSRPKFKLFSLFKNKNSKSKNKKEKSKK